MNASVDRSPTWTGPPRWPWLGAAALLLLAAAATVWSSYLHWLPCRGRMLDGTVLGHASDAGYPEACLHRMDTSSPFPYPPEPAEQTPWASELGAAAVALSGLAWLVLVLGMRWSMWTRLVATVPAAISLSMALVAAAAAADHSRDSNSYPSLWFLLSGEVAAVAALVVIWRRQPAMRGRLFGRLVVLAWGATAFGLVHEVFEYAFMTEFNDANWDNPPGTGYGTVLVLLVAAVVAALGVPRISSRRRASEDQPARRPQTAAGSPAESPRAS